jgi:DNA-binding NtrC family response regulator
MRRESPNTAVVMMTSFARVSDVVGSLREGAVDYVTKPFDPEAFVSEVLGPISQRRSLMKKFEEVGAEAMSGSAGELVGISRSMRQLAHAIAAVANSDSPVIVWGEGGTGRNLVARNIHAQSPRRDGPLLVVPCSALPELMLESELQELAEMRSRARRDQWFRAAEGGTLVLDGVEMLTASAQSRLLRILDEPSLRARRSRQWQPLGVRLIGVMNDDPRPPVLLRHHDLEPLLLRLGTISLQVPALAERDDDVYVLTRHFLREFTPPGRTEPNLTPKAWQALSARRFRGNVRELAWTLERAVAAAGDGDVDLHHLPEAQPLSA